MRAASQQAGHSPSLPSVQKVENAGLLFTDNPAGVSGTDAGYSLPLGRQTLWLFGDVFLLDPHSPAQNYVGGVSNCALLVPAGSGTMPLRQYTFLTEPKTGTARQVIPNGVGEGNEIRYWPFGGWYSERDKRAYLFYARIRTTNGEGPFAFRTEGHGLAVADATTPANLKFARLPAMAQGAGFRIQDSEGGGKGVGQDSGVGGEGIGKEAGRELWWRGEDGRPVFGSAVVANCPGEYLYIVGVEERAGKKWGKMARVLKTRIADFSAYEYYAGGQVAARWSRDLSTALDVEGLADFPSELSVAYNAYLGGYLAIHSIGISDKARLSLAPHPWGPYKPIGEIGTPHRAFARAFCYAGKEHPELAQEHGRIVYLTYVDSDRYWLNLLKVTLQK